MRTHESIKQYVSTGREGPCALCIGNFDGVHLGHRHVIGTCIRHARRMKLATVVLTFEPHPLQVLRPSVAPQRITTPVKKAALLASTGLSHLVSHPFDRELALLPAERFVKTFIVDQLQARVLVVGSRFRFGRDRRGDVKMLVAMGRELGFEVRTARGYRLEGEVVSSRHVRKLIGEDGDVLRAGRLLGRFHSVGGLVVKGEGRGRLLGFPTANLDRMAEILPAPGIYACRTVVEGLTLPAAVHVGPRMTFDQVSTVEAHVVGWDHGRDLYGERLEVEFLSRLRDPVKFVDADALVRQIRLDVERTVETVKTPPAIEARP